MTAKYSWVYGMWEVKIWMGPEKPDQPKLLLENDSDYEESENEDESDPNPSGTPPPSIGNGWICFGIHVQEALYVDPKIREVLRLYSLGEIQSKFPGCTRKQLNTAKDALNVGAFQIASLTLAAVDPNVVYPLFGKIHATTIVLGSCAILDEMSNFFSNESFQVGPDKVKYRVVPGTFEIKYKRQKPEPIA